MRRRSVLIGAGLAVASPLGGCLGILDEPLTFEATRVSVSESTLERTGYREEDVSELVFEQTFEVAGQTREVEVRNWQATYSKGVELPGVGHQQAALFVALSTPKVDVLGRTINPVGDMSATDLADEVQSQFDEIDSLQLRSESTIEILGEQTRLTTFTGDARLASALSVEMELYVTEAVESGDDFVVTIGAHPRLLAGEKEHVLAMMDSVRHG